MWYILLCEDGQGGEPVTSTRLARPPYPKQRGREGPGRAARGTRQVAGQLNGAFRGLRPERGARGGGRGIILCCATLIQITKTRLKVQVFRFFYIKMKVLVAICFMMRKYDGFSDKKCSPTFSKITSPVVTKQANPDNLIPCIKCFSLF